MQCSPLTPEVMAPEYYSDPQAATHIGRIKDPKLLREGSLHSRLPKPVALQL